MEPSPDFIAIDGAGTPGGIILDPSPTSGRPNAKIFFKVEALKTKLAQAEKLGAKGQKVHEVQGGSTKLAQKSGADSRENDPRFMLLR